MKNYLKNLRISRKFNFLASVVISVFTILTLIVLFAFGYIYKMDYDFDSQQGEVFDEVLDIAKEVRAIQSRTGLALYFDLAGNEKSLEKNIQFLEENRDNLISNIDFVETHFNEELGSNHEYSIQVKKLAASVDELEVVLNDLIAALKSGNTVKAEKIVQQSGGIIDETLDLANGARNNVIKAIDVYTARTEEVVRFSFFAVVSGYVISLIIAIVITKIIGKIINDNFKELSDSVKCIADGELENVVALNQKDEIGDLSRNIAFAADNVLTLVDDMKDSVNKFVNEGYLEPKLDSEKYVGNYRELAETYNNVFDSFTAGVAEVFDSLDKIVKGDFNLELTDYQGERASINDSLRSVTNKIESIYNEITSIVTSTANGDLSHRANTENFDGKWKDTLENLNLLSNSIAEPFEEFKAVLNEVAHGNLQGEITGKYEGEFQEVSDIINHTIKELSMYISIISTTLNSISHERNLDLSIDTQFLGEFDQIKVAINTIIDTYNGMFRDFLATANELSDVSVSLTDGSVTVATGASEQVTTLNELNTTVELVSNNTKDNAESSQKANQISATSRDNAINGDKEMKTMLDAMEEIKSASSDIENIIKVIDDIAFQTNLLALNAAVEAAHAGQHGRGFAVVAEEVGNLASRSKVAAEQTSELIKRSLEKVELGSKLANSTAGTLNDILENVTEVSSLLEGISGASTTQATSLSEISQSLKSFEGIVQTYTATSEQSVATSEELSAQAEELRSSLSNFTLRP